MPATPFLAVCFPNMKHSYAWLADMIQGPRSQAHIGYLREYYCEQVIQQSKAILANRKEAQQAVSQTRRQLRAGGETV